MHAALDLMQKSDDLHAFFNALQHPARIRLDARSCAVA